MITYDDFARVEIKAGKILSAEKIPDTDKLLKLSVDFAEATPRQIISGIAMHFPDPTALVGRTAMFVTNLEARTIRGYESNGMLFAVSTPASVQTGTDAATPGFFSLLEPGPGIPPGTRAK
jgi:methionine--tRNA ligase beta chain